MTDIIKGVVQPVSGKLVSWLKQNPHVVATNIDALRAELSDLGYPRPTILAFGGAAHELLQGAPRRSRVLGPHWVAAL
jgi:hypothetical protein